MANKDKAIIVIKKKRGGGHGGHHGGAWKVAYADFVTAMMAFFLVMWLMGVDEETKAAIAGHFNGTIDRDAPPVNAAPEIPKGGAKMEDLTDPLRFGGRPIDLPVGRTTAQAARNDLVAMKEDLEESVSLQLGLTSESATRLETYVDARGLVLRIVAADFFAHRDAYIQGDMTPILYKVGAVLARYRNSTIRVEGHTDVSEQVEGDPSESWTLSTARAQSVVQFWMQRYPSLSPRRMQIAGASHFRPIGDSKTEVGRATNRRVEITVMQTIPDMPTIPSGESSGSPE